MFVLGLTGGIGSGKTAVSDVFATLGVEVVDTDLIAHQLTSSGAEGTRQLQQLFGDAVVDADGRLNRRVVRELVFADNDARQRLEAVLHPLIRSEAARQLQAVTSRYGVLVVPLLAESPHFQALCDRILVVDCSEAVQLERVMRRSGLQRADVEAIMAAQAPRIARLALADDVLDNSGGRDALQARVLALHQQYLTLADLRKTRE